VKFGGLPSHSVVLTLFQKHSLALFSEVAEYEEHYELKRHRLVDNIQILPSDHLSNPKMFDILYKLARGHNSTNSVTKTIGCRNRKILGTNHWWCYSVGDVHTTHTAALVASIKRGVVLTV
jgi:hypothetical protein